MDRTKYTNIGMTGPGRMRDEKIVQVSKERERGDGHWPIQRYRCLEALRSEEEIREASAVDINVCSAEAKVRVSARVARKAVVSENAIRAEGDSRCVFVRDWTGCSMKFLDADVWNPMALMTSTVDRRQRVNTPQRITTGVTRS